MSKLTIKVMRHVRDQIEQATKELKAMDAKKGKYHGALAFSHWAEWNLMAYVNQEARLAEWEQFKASIEARLKEGYEDDNIVRWIEGWRDGLVEIVMGGYAQHSTNQIANMIEAEKIDVKRKMAGMRMIDSGSLEELLSNLK